MLCVLLWDASDASTHLQSSNVELFTPDTPACLHRYNSALVATYGYSALSAVWDSATYTNSPETPYSLVMQSVRCCCQKKQ